MNKFDLFLQQANFKDNQLKLSELKQVVIKQATKTWLFKLEYQEVVNPDSLLVFLQQLEIFFLVPDVVSKVDYQINFNNNDLKQYAEKYFDLVLAKAIENNPSLSAFKNYQRAFNDNTYTIYVEPDGLAIEKMLPQLRRMFKKFGLNPNIELEVSVELKPLETVIQNQVEDAIESVKNREVVSEKIVDKKVSFTTKFSPNEVPLNQIPLDQYGLDKYRNEKGDLNFLIKGEISKIEKRELPNSTLVQISVFDNNDAIIVKRFVKAQKDLEIINLLKVGDFIQITGRADYDTYQRSVVIMANNILQVERKVKDKRTDNAKEKRVEFHVHTKMSALDGVTSAEEYLTTLEDWGHEAVAFTDHNGVYAFPEIFNTIKKKKLKIKPIYGVELDYIDENNFKFTNEFDFDCNLKDATYVVFDVETTGFSAVNDKIIEIGAVRVKNGEIIDTYQSFVNISEPLTETIKRITNIDDDMLFNAPSIEQVLPEFLAYAKDAILVGHNALFDYAFIMENIKRLNLGIQGFPIIDTLNLARYFYSNQIKRFRLETLAKHFGVSLKNAHRADADAKATAEVFLNMQSELGSKVFSTYKTLNQIIDPKVAWKHQYPSHITVLAATQVGYKNLFKLVSDALTTHFHSGAKALRSVIEQHREGLLIGSACDSGEVFEMALNKSDDDLARVIEFYDYIEVQPPQAYAHLRADRPLEEDNIIKATIQKIIKYAKAANKLVIATSNAHYLNKEDQKSRDIYIAAKAVGGGLHPHASTFKDHNITPMQYLLTTKEMLSAFEFLGEELANEIVITNTKLLNKKIDNVTAFPKELYSIADDAFKDVLGIESIAITVEKMVYDKAHELYGDRLPLMITQRIEKELKSIITNQFAPIYYMSHLLVKKSLEDGYLVGSRGSVGSSFVATLLDITEVNPLRPHYRCPNRDFSVFKLLEDEVYKYPLTEDQQKFLPILKAVQSGYDLPDHNCPICNAKLIKDGQDIPFETFLGFDGDKIPDIDLNFSGEYQAIAHEYVKELIGSEHSYRGGTISTIAEKTAFGYVKGFLEDKNKSARDAQIERLAKGIEGTRRSTGQHPGGIIVVPKDKEIYDVTPIQYPADDVNSPWKTTHFDYHSFEDNLLKLDILGHDDPTMIKYLMDYVKKNPTEFPFNRAQDIPVDDPKVYQLFQGTDVIGFNNDPLYGKVASYAVPELGTPFVREMLQNTKPTNFSGLVKISGLSHGTDVWLKNAYDLVTDRTEFGKISFDDVIGCRDDIMVQLIEFGLDPFKSFEIMEFVRRGRPSSMPTQWKEYETVMRSYKVPEWYIWSCGQIKYMFPKAHAAAYVLMAMRIAWFKVYSPLLFYSAFFSKRVSQFDYEVMIAGTNGIRNKIQELTQGNQKLTAKDGELITTLNIAYEMTKRGFKFLPIDLEKSDAYTFVMEESGIRMPFISIDGLGASVAEDLIINRQTRAFSSKEDLKQRTKLNKTVFDKLESFGVFEKLKSGSGVIDVGLFSEDL